MRLISLEYADPYSGWRLAPMEFLPDITLLVGLSGVGKTRILDTVSRLKRIATGHTSRDLYGIRWELAFENDGLKYTWDGEFSADPAGDSGQGPILSPFFDDGDEEESERPVLLRETLRQDGAVLAHRSGESITLNGQQTPKLSRSQSLISIFRNEDAVMPCYSGMEKILMVDHSEDVRKRHVFDHRSFDQRKKKYTTIDKIRSADLPTHVKLALAHDNCRGEFDNIVRQLQEAFPTVEDVRFKLVNLGPFGEVPRLYLRERGVEKTIPEENISSGMHRTLMHLSRMALWPDGTVVLIDEFENSFGVNCINFVTHDLQLHSQRMQFILTSHHPYIINNISIKNWKIVQRRGDSVHVEGSALLGKKSSHEAFLRLLNMPEFVEGIVAE